MPVTQGAMTMDGGNNNYYYLLLLLTTNTTTRRHQTYTRTHDADLDTCFRIPPSKAVKHIHAIQHVEVVHGTFSVEQKCPEQKNTA